MNSLYRGQLSLPEPGQVLKRAEANGRGRERSLNHFRRPPSGSETEIVSETSIFFGENGVKKSSNGGPTLNVVGDGVVGNFLGMFFRELFFDTKFFKF